MTVIRTTSWARVASVLVLLGVAPFAVLALLGLLTGGGAAPLLWMLGGATVVSLPLWLLGRPGRIEVSPSRITRDTGRRTSSVDLEELADVGVEPDGPLIAYTAGVTGSALEDHICTVTDAHGQTFRAGLKRHRAAALWAQVLAAARRRGVPLGGPAQDVLAWYASDKDRQAVTDDRSARPETAATPPDATELRQRGGLGRGRVTPTEVVIRSGLSGERRVRLDELLAVELTPDTREPYASGPLHPRVHWGVGFAQRDWPQVVLRDRSGRTLNLPVDNHWNPALPLWRHVLAAIERNRVPLTADARWTLRYLAGLDPDAG